MTMPATPAKAATLALCVRWLAWRVAFAVLCVSLVMFGDCLILWLFRDELASKVAARIQQYLPGWEVQLRSLDRIDGYGVVLRGLSIRDPSRGSEPGRLLEVDEVRVRCATNLESLLSGHSHPSQIVIRRPRLSLAGLDSLLQLLENPALVSGQAIDVFALPEIRVQDGVVLLTDPVAGELRVQKVAATWAQATGESSAGAAEQWNLQLSYASGRLGQGVVTAGFRPKTGVWRADALVQELHLDADLWRSAGPWLTNLPDNWGLSGRIDGQVAVGKTAKAAVPWFQVRGRFTNGRVSGPDGETELHDANGAIYADQQQLRLDSFVGRCKNSQVTASGIRQGWRRAAPLRLSIHAANLDLTRSMIALLPDSMQEQWRTVQALGYLDVRLQLSFSHGQWDSQATLRCRDISLKYELFPYPLQGVHGLVRMSNQRTDINLRAVVDGRVVRIESMYYAPGGGKTNWLEVSTDGLVALTPQLVTAFPADTRRMLSALQAAGKVSASARLEEPPGGPMKCRIELTVRDGSVRFVDFPYPIDGIAGRLVIDDERCVIKELQGWKGQAQVDCEGLWDPLAQDGRSLRLRFECRNVPLDDQLKQAMNADGQRVWEELRPSGMLQQITLKVAYDPERRDMQWDLSGDQTQVEQPPPGGEFSLFPRRFPFQLDKIRGRFAYADGWLRLDDVRAGHGPTTLRVQGGWLADQDSWRLKLDRLTARRIVADRALQQALPEGLRKIVTRLQPSGSLAVDGQLTLEGRRAESSLTALWDMKVDLENVTVQGGIPLESIRGAVRLAGQADGHGFRNRGDLYIDSLMIRNVQVTALRGPFWVDPRQVVLGSPPGPSHHVPPLFLTGKTLGGKLIARGLVMSAPHSPFVWEAQLREADLQQAALAVAPANRAISGQLYGDVHLQGNAYGLHTWHGDGALRVRQADVYAAPFMVKLLSKLQIRAQDSSAFSSGDIDVRVEGEHLYLDRIELSSDAVTLRGRGEVSGQRDVSANLYAAVRGQEKLAGRVFHAASRQLLQIDVNGTLDDPRIHRRPLPELNDTIHRLFPELVRSDHPSTEGPLRRLADAWNPASRVAPAGAQQER